MNDIIERIMYKIRGYLEGDKRTEAYRNNGKEL